MNILAEIFVLKYAFNFLGIIPKSRIARLSMFNFLKNCQTVFHHNYTMLYSYQECIGLPISLHITLAIIWLLLLYYHYYCHASRYKVISHCNFHCISLMTTEVSKHLFMRLLAILYLLWRNVNSNPLPIFSPILCVVFLHYLVVSFDA